MKNTSNVALKEWPSTIRALRDGRQIVLLRKGGLSDKGGRFFLRESEFFLYPSHEHEKAEQLQPGAFQPIAFKGTATLDTYAEVMEVRQVKSEEEIQFLPSMSVWTPAFLSQRLRYKPENPLYLILARCYRLATPHTITETPAYAGCKSWVPLETELATIPSVPSLSDDEFEERRRAVLAALEENAA